MYPGKRNESDKGVKINNKLSKILEIDPTSLTRIEKGNEKNITYSKVEIIQIIYSLNRI